MQPQPLLLKVGLLLKHHSIIKDQLLAYEVSAKP